MKISALVSAVGLVTALVGATGCGSGSGASCSNTAACGGSIVGTWTITSSCVNISLSDYMNSSCPGLTVNTSNATITGNATYNADGTYTQTGTTNGTIRVSYPQSCLTMNGVTITCDQINQAVQANPTAGVTLTCTGSGTSGCSCTETIAGQTSSESGTYTTTSSGLLTQTPTGGSVSTSDYCVKGTMMTQSPHPGSYGMGAAVSGTITLTKS